MNRFVGFQDAQGVAVLDTVSGELVYCPFHDGAPRQLRPAVVEAAATADAAEDAAELGEVGTLESFQIEAGDTSPSAAFRPERRLQAPRPLVIRYPDATEVAAIKRARLARASKVRWATGRDGAPDGSEPEDES